MDGTLVDTVLDISLAVNHALISLNASPLEVDEIRRYVGHGLNDLLKKCLRSEDQDRIEKASAIFGDYYSLHLADNSCPYPYVEETLEYFKKKKQAVFTNKPNPFSRDLIRCLGLEKYFIEVIACGAEYPKKPDPAAVDMLVSSQKVSKEQTLLF